MNLTTNLGLTISTLLLAACGGGSGEGSGGGPSVAVAVAAVPLSYPVLSSFQGLVARGEAKSFVVSGTCTGAGTRTTSPAATEATFEGVAGLSATTTLTMSLTGAGCTPSMAQTFTTYFDTNYLPRGFDSVGANYGYYLLKPNIPTTAAVGATGLIGTQLLFLSSEGRVGNGRIDSSYVIEADAANSPNTAVLNAIAKIYNASGTLTATEQDRYRMTPTGTMTPISIDIQYTNASATHWVLTF